MILGQALILAAIALQSGGKVLYGTLLQAVASPLYVLVGMSLTALVALAFVRFRLPAKGLGEIAQANLWTAISFLSMFFALKHLPPAIFASIEIGMSLLAAILLSLVQTRVWPEIYRALACVGIVAGCSLLAWFEVSMSTVSTSSAMVWIAIAASMATGASSVLTVSSCQKLAAFGWSSCSVLAHRFYATIAAAAVWLALESGAGAQGFAVELLPGIALVSAVGILIPLLLLQMALRRVDKLSIMVLMAAQPAISFLLSALSPTYGWNLVTLLGVAMVSFFVLLDVVYPHVRDRLPKSSDAAIQA